MATELHTDPRTNRILSLLADLVRELHPDRPLPRFGPASDLARDAGLDSLARVELMLRLQQEFDVRFPDETAIAARTVADLVRAIAHAVPARHGDAGRPRVEPSLPGTPPPGPATDALTLIDVLDHHAALQPGAVHLVLCQDDQEQTLTYGDLHAGAGEVAAGLRARGLEPGDRVALMLPTGLDFFLALHGILRAGGVPVPLYPPVRADRIEDHARRLARVLSNAGTRLFIASTETRPAGRLLQGLVRALEHIVTVPDLCARADPAGPVPRAGGDLALLQYTSGTTDVPKGVMLTHANLLANIRAMGAAVGASAEDRFVSWLPLYHDMGLIGACLATLYYGIRIILMSPLQFMARPASWLGAIDRHRGTISAGPNFAYDLCARRIDDAAVEDLDLTSWRLAFNGAEPVGPGTLERFAERFAPCGFRSEAFMPVYGLAESSVGLAFPMPGHAPRIDRVHRTEFERQGRAIAAGADDRDTLRFVACGHVLAGHALRIVDGAGEPVPARTVGRIQFRGPSCTSGYFDNPEATHALFADGWLESGDLGYVADGDLIPTGRIKDLIIRAGRNIHPQEIERALSEVPGIRRNNVAAFAYRAPGADIERLVVLAETRETDTSRRDEIRAAAIEAVVGVLDGPPDEIVLVPPGTIPKTSSGKIRRGDCGAIYARGATQRRASTQLLRLAAAGTVPTVRRGAVAALRLLFAAWCWILAICIGLPSALLIVMTPGTGARAGIARAATRSLLVLSRTPIRVTGETPPPAAGHVLVANHASYLDGLVLRAVLRGPLFFVAKRELAGSRLVRLFLERIGVEFVDRFDHERGLTDLARIRARTAHGETVVSFPEGTFGDGAGLRGFRVGAFMVAARAGRPVVPVAIRGTRVMLRGESRLPRPARLAVTIGRPLLPRGNDWNAALALRDRARAFILEHCGEPDLAPVETGVPGNP